MVSTPTVYMVVELYNYKPKVMIGGNLRPPNECLREIIDAIQKNVDKGKCLEVVHERSNELPQDRDPESDFSGSYVQLGLAKVRIVSKEEEIEYDITYKWQDYKFISGDISLPGRDPADCDKGWVKFPTNEYYTTNDEKPEEWDRILR